MDATAQHAEFRALFEDVDGAVNRAIARQLRIAHDARIARPRCVRMRGIPDEQFWPTA